LGLGRTCSMTTNAQHSGIKLWRNYVRRIVGMIAQRPMTCLAIHLRVFAVLLRVQHIRVAAFACLVAGKVYRAGGNLAHRSSTIVAVLPKALRNDVVAYDQKRQKRE